MPFVSDEVVTAAKLNLATAWAQDIDTGSGRTFTNTGYLDLDALTGGAGTLTAVIVTILTGTSAKVTISSPAFGNDTLGGHIMVSYRVSGATTVASADTAALRTRASNAANNLGASYVHLHTGLTAGVNVFELQARVTANTGTLVFPELIVETVVP